MWEPHYYSFVHVWFWLNIWVIVMNVYWMFTVNIYLFFSSKRHDGRAIIGARQYAPLIWLDFHFSSIKAIIMQGIQIRGAIKKFITKFIYHGLFWKCCPLNWHLILIFMSLHRHSYDEWLWYINQWERNETRIWGIQPGRVSGKYWIILTW